jgi:hypothetical protein
MPFFVSRIRPVRGDPRFPRHRLALLVFQQLIAVIVRLLVKYINTFALGSHRLITGMRWLAGAIEIKPDAGLF